MQNLKRSGSAGTSTDWKYAELMLKKSLISKANQIPKGSKIGKISHFLKNSEYFKVILLLFILNLESY